MSKDNNNLPLSELLRPKRLDEVALPERIILGLQRMFDTQTPDNMLAESEAKRPPIPTEGGQRFRSKAATQSERRRPPC
jgi:hypothetical protein